MQKSKYNILYITPFSLTKLNNGGAVRSWNIAKQLSDKFILTVYCYSESVANVEKKNIFNVKTVLCPLTTNKLFKFKKYLQWIMCGVSRNTYTYTKNKYFYEMINNEILKNHVILVETILMAPIIKKWDHKKFYIISHQNNESSVYKDMARRENIFKKYLLRYDSYKILKDENRLMRKFDINYFVSRNEARIYQDDSHKVINALLLPNGVDVKKYIIDKSVERTEEIIFVGTYKWAPNVDAVNYFLDRIWIKVLENYDSAKFTIIGSGGGERKRWKKLKNVNYIGEVNDPIKYYQKAKMMVVPLLSGGGTRLKILEAMACGLPVISTPKGIEGLDLLEGKEYLLAKTPEEFLNNILILFNNQKKWEELSHNGRKAVKKHYSWDIIGRNLQKEIISYVEGKWIKKY